MATATPDIIKPETTKTEEQLIRQEKKDLKEAYKNIKALPKKVIPLMSPDKIGHESWDRITGIDPNEVRDPANFPAPYRMLICGPVGYGKTCLIKNILMRAFEPFKKIFARHNDIDYKELAECNVEVINELPPPSDLNPKEEKIAVLLDDFKIDGWSSSEKDNLNQLLQYGSSHKNISVIISTQRLINVPMPLRACINIFIIYKPNNLPDLDIIAPRISVDTYEFRKIVKDNLKTCYDNICLDFTPASPYPIRLNIWDKIRSGRVA